jgi:hypothetical protein
MFFIGMPLLGSEGAAVPFRELQECILPAALFDYLADSPRPGNGFRLRLVGPSRLIKAQWHGSSSNVSLHLVLNSFKQQFNYY